MGYRLRQHPLVLALGLASSLLAGLAVEVSAAVFTPRRSHTQTLLADGNILVIGGLSSENPITYLGSAAGGVQRLNEQRGTVENLTAMAINRSSHTATLLPDGRVLVAGGINGGGAVATYNIYNPVANSWLGEVALAGGARYNHTASLLKDGRVLLCGGQTGAGAVLGTCDVFTPGYGLAADTMLVGPPMLSGRTNHTATMVFNGEIFVTGGWNPALTPTYTNLSERFRPDVGANGTWVPARALNEGRAYHTATAMGNGKVLIAGGCNGGAFNGLDRFGNRGILESTEIYDPISNEMTLAVNMRARKQSFAALLNSNGIVNISGGLGNVPTSYVKPDLMIRSGSFLTGPAAWNGNNPPNSNMDLGETYSSAPVTGGSIQFPLSFFLTKIDGNISEVTGVLREAELLLSTPSITFTGGYAFLNEGRGDGYGVPPFYGGRVNLAGYPVSCSTNAQGDSVACGAVGRDPATFVGLSEGPMGGTYGFARFTPSNSGSATDATGCIDFSDPAAMGGDERIQNSETLPVRSNCPTNRCPNLGYGANRNKWAANLTIGGFPGAVIGGVISSGTLFVSGAAISTTSSASAEIKFDVSISSMFAEIPVGAPITLDPASEQPAGLTTFLANFRDIAGSVTTTTTTLLSGPVGGALKLTVTNARVKYVSSRVDVSGNSLTIQMSTVIVRSMVFGDVEEYKPSTNEWIKTRLNTSFVDSRLYHTATLSPGGVVRFWGGKTCDYIFDSLCTRDEVNPLGMWNMLFYKDSWNPTGSMTNPRGNHTTTLLPSGNLLVAGGNNGESVFKACEIYNYRTRTFSNTGEMVNARDLHTASLLNNGKVLVAGGFSTDAVSTGATNTAELYYPDEGVWRPAGAMNRRRDSHTAVNLPDGNILVFGGYDRGSYLDSTEIYYSTVGAWREIPGPTAQGLGACPGGGHARAKHTATRLKDGRILFAGGVNGTEGVLSSALLLNISNTDLPLGWSCAQRIGLPGLVRPVHSHSAVLLPGGNVLVSFGNDGSGQAEFPPLSLLYDPIANTWTSVVGLNQKGATFNHTATQLPTGNVLIVGGSRGLNSSQRAAFLFDLMGSTYSSVGPMATPRAWHTTSLTPGQDIVAIGGYNNGRYLTTAEYYPIGIAAAFDAEYLPSVRQATVTLVSPTIALPGTNIIIRDRNLTRVTEAASGATNGSSHFHPRLVLQAVDPSGGTATQAGAGFLIDMTTRVYHSIVGSCPAANQYCNRWNKGAGGDPNLFGYYGFEKIDASTTSLIEVRLPEASTAIPNGWYHLREAANEVYSDSLLVRVGPPLPLAPTAATGTVISSTTIYWTWPDLGGQTVGYNVYYASSPVFITTRAVPTAPNSADFLQDGLTPNVTAQIITQGFSQTGDGATTVSAYAFTLATVPASIRFSTIQPNSVNMEWSANGNSLGTIYEVTIALDPAFTSGVRVPTADFAPYTTTFLEITGLRELTTYYLRMRAQNLAGTWTDFVYSSFTSRWPFISINGRGCTTNTQYDTADVCILWQWASTGTAVSYNIYSATVVPNAPGYKLNAAPLIQVGANVSFTDSPPLKPNTPRGVFVTGLRANGEEWPLTLPTTVYTWASEPRQSFPDPYLVINDSGSIHVRWDTNANNSGTRYFIYYATRTAEGFNWRSTGTVQTAAGLMIEKIQGLTPSELYYASMTAVNYTGTATSGTALGSIITMPNEPSELRISAASPNTVTLVWANNSNTSSTTYEVTYTTDDPNTKPATELTIYTFRSFAEFNGTLESLIDGLETGKRYYFRVRAQNLVGLINTSFSSAVSTITPTGGAGASSGQLGGTLKASADTGISGTIGSPTVRTVTLSSPAGAFSTNVDVVITTRDVSGGANLCSAGLGVSISIIPTPYIQPVKPLTLTFSYTAAELAGADPAKVVLMRYDPAKNKCVPLPTVVDTVNLKITALINHLSDFQLAAVTPPTDPHGAKAFPNPFFKSRDGYVTLSEMPPFSRIRIFNLQGDLILDRLATGAGMLDWGGLNMWGRTVASGMYLVVIQHGDDKKILKVVVLR